jgi:hypothetical protein
MQVIPWGFEALAPIRTPWIIVRFLKHTRFRFN